MERVYLVRRLNRIFLFLCDTSMWIAVEPVDAPHKLIYLFFHNKHAITSLGFNRMVVNIFSCLLSCFVYCFLNMFYFIFFCSVVSAGAVLLSFSHSHFIR